MSRLRLDLRTRPYRASSSAPSGAKPLGRVAPSLRGKLARSKDFKALLVLLDEMAPVEGWPEGFSTRAWLENWLQKPIAALAGKRPLDYLGTQEGLQQVSRVLWAMTGHVYV